MELKNTFPVTYPDIFRLRDQNTQNQYDIFPLGFLSSREILYDSACVYTQF